MKVHLIGRPSIDLTAAVHATDLVWYPADDSDSAADDLAEFAGRACYQSWHRPNPATAIQEFAREILAHLRREAPHSVQDLVDPKEA